MVAMAWNPSPQVAAARDIGRRFKRPQVIIIMLDQEIGEIELATYGETRELCREAGKLGDVAYDAVRSWFGA